MHRNIKLVLAYDGTDFHGWQRQPGLRTVQQELEDALQRILGQPVSAAGASRTDAGVHARGQVASVRIQSPIPVASLVRALSRRLPADMNVIHGAPAAPTFHPARDARAKLYRYQILNPGTPGRGVGRPDDPFAYRYAWYVWHPLDLDAMRTAAAHLVGTHDFAAFAGQGGARDATVRTVQRITLGRSTVAGNLILIDVQGDAFLYHQVRNMVGTLVEVGRGHWPPQRVAEILASHDRRQAGPTAPPQGLCLQWVRYDDAPEPSACAVED